MPGLWGSLASTRQLPNRGLERGLSQGAVFFACFHPATALKGRKEVTQTPSR